MASSLRPLRSLATCMGTHQFMRPAAIIPKTRVSPFQYSNRFYTTTPPVKNGGKFSPLLWIGLASLGGAYSYYQNQRAINIDASLDQDKKPTEPKKELNTNGPSTPAPTNKPDNTKKTAAEKNIDYQQVYNDIAELLDSNPEYDDGSYGPVLLRLAWHSSGTYNVKDGSGGSNGGTMRFKAESSHSANNGLEVARDLLEKHIKPKYPELSYGDMYTLGGVVAVQELGGPDIKWRPGRRDQGENMCTPDGRLPDGSKKADHVRDIFYRMGFNDREIVALTGGHALGRCHLDRSGYEGPWQEAPTFFTNEYYRAITTREWVKKDLPNGNWQWSDKNNPDIMMLPIEIAMLEDEKLRPYFELYAKDAEQFFEDFAKAFKKLIELGVPFTGEEKEYVFKRVNV
ncbi:heme peroxidase [Cokeromyces recurvatus]|uniref:heme peroxidase n=1 Tax=Cokeromyces recurvatus TaxID=90255 RepID=UPI00221E3E52|nr:heme peroxidase [Cokeromyces recurvatus]KAI7904841.1 heme peroxidase [Cokeromyces recurvatus]